MMEDGRKILIIRHGERLDCTFNCNKESWLSKAIDENGKYRRTNLNMPQTLFPRRESLIDYANDTPLTELGYLESKLCGRALADNNFTLPTQIYASPSFRCVQNAKGVIQGTGLTTTKICIEPGLFEWCAWFDPEMPTFLEPSEFSKHHYPINVDYQPMYKQPLATKETLRDYYERSNQITTQLLARQTELDGPNAVLVIIAHGSSLDACSRQMIGFPPRSRKEFCSILHQTPFMAMVMMKCLTKQTSKQWSIVKPPLPPLTHQGNPSFDWRIYEGDNVHTLHTTTAPKGEGVY